MNFLLWHDRIDDIKRTENAARSIIVHTKRAIFWTGVFPGHHENREALFGQIFHERILRRKIKNVVFHNPGRDDENWFGPHIRGHWHVLDQLNESIAIYDLPWRNSDVSADRKSLCAHRLFAADRTLPILDEMLSAPDEIESACTNGALKDFWIGHRKIWRRDHVEELTRPELKHLLVSL